MREQMPGDVLNTGEGRVEVERPPRLSDERSRRAAQRATMRSRSQSGRQSQSRRSRDDGSMAWQPGKCLSARRCPGESAANDNQYREKAQLRQLEGRREGGEDSRERRFREQ